MAGYVPGAPYVPGKRGMLPTQHWCSAEAVRSACPMMSGGRRARPCGFHACTDSELQESSLRARISWVTHLLLPDYDASCPAALPERLRRLRFFNPQYRAHRGALNVTAAVEQWAQQAPWLVSPNHRLMVCAIEKNGATQWIEFFRAALGQKVGSNQEAWGALNHWAARAPGCTQWPPGTP